jgi:uncharacterized protein (DUF427 family)
MEFLRDSARTTFCEWKGAGSYYSIRVGDRTAPDAAWTYLEPTGGFRDIAGYIAFYPGPMDECRVDGEKVVPQPGGFYGGWITADIKGPFKGAPGTVGW